MRHSPPTSVDLMGWRDLGRGGGGSPAGCMRSCCLQGLRQHQQQQQQHEQKRKEAEDRSCLLEQLQTLMPASPRSSSSSTKWLSRSHLLLQQQQQQRRLGVHAGAWATASTQQRKAGGSNCAITATTQHRSITATAAAVCSASSCGCRALGTANKRADPDIFRKDGIALAQGHSYPPPPIRGRSGLYGAFPITRCTLSLSPLACLMCLSCPVLSCCPLRLTHTVHTASRPCRVSLPRWM